MTHAVGDTEHQSTEAPSLVPVTLKPVWTSPSFWVSVLPVVSGIVGFIFHKQVDLTPDARAIALLATALSAAVLAISRSMHHASVLAYNQTMAAIQQHSWVHDAGTATDRLDHRYFRVEQAQMVINPLAETVNRLLAKVDEMSTHVDQVTGRVALHDRLLTEPAASPPSPMN